MSARTGTPPLPDLHADSVGSVRAALIALSLLAAVLRITQAARLECVSRDGVHYVEFAKQLADDPIFYLRAHRSQPGYSLALLGTHRIIGTFVAADPVLAWQRCGQLLAIAAGVAVVPLVFALAAALFDRSCALIAAAFAALWPHAIECSADVLTDMPHLALYLLAMLLAIRAMRTGRFRPIAAAGLIAGAAYLVRQEALALPIGIAAAWWFATAAQPVRRRIAGMAAVALTFSLAVAPYVAATGSLLHKKGLHELLQGPQDENAAIRVPHDIRSTATPRLAGAVTLWSAPLSAAEGWARSGRYVFSTLAFMGVLWHRVPRAERSALRLVAVLAALHVAAVLLRGRSFGVISIRYMIVPAALCLPWSAAAFKQLAAVLRARSRTRAPVVVAALICIIPLLAPLRYAPNRGKLHLYDAGLWLRAHSDPADVVLTRPQLSPLVFYADRARYWPEGLPADRAIAEFDARRPTWFADFDAPTEPSQPPTPDERRFLERVRERLNGRPPDYSIDARGGRRIRLHRLAPPPQPSPARSL
ncbi:MAG: glycosyltransferase family 39 protein [Phycisphaerae bacterium]|nr:glycosyltransferase family 39 protein [Phycisphaerae bacterium]